MRNKREWESIWFFCNPTAIRIAWKQLINANMQNMLYTVSNRLKHILQKVVLMSVRISGGFLLFRIFLSRRQALVAHAFVKASFHNFMGFVFLHLKFEFPNSNSDGSLKEDIVYAP